MEKTSSRLASLDILRGFDLFLLVFFQPVLVALGRVVDAPWMDAVLYHFDHEVWAGFRFWDLVMPLFLFMTGVSMPFSMAKYKGNPDGTLVYKKIMKRFVVLFVFGMMVQGNLLWLDVSGMYFYNNTLQAIASGYLISALLFLNCSLKTQVYATVMLLVAYWLPMTFCGDFSLEGNFAYKVEQLVFGENRGDASYTWVWSSLTFGATVMSGNFAGQIMKNKTLERKNVVKLLLCIGLGLVVAGWLWSFQMPIIKRIWTSSMTLFASGFCFVLMGGFYYWIDYKGYSKGLGWLKYYGMNSITAYMIGEMVNFRCVAHSVCYGLERYMGGYYPVLLTFLNFLVLFFMLRFMYRNRVFLKI